MELLFINMGIIVFFLIWAFILINKSCGVDVKDDLAWQKYVESRMKRNKYDENQQIKQLKEQQRINRAFEKAKKIK